MKHARISYLNTHGGAWKYSPATLLPSRSAQERSASRARLTGRCRCLLRRGASGSRAVCRSARAARADGTGRDGTGGSCSKPCLHFGSIRDVEKEHGIASADPTRCAGAEASGSESVPQSRAQCKICRDPPSARRGAKLFPPVPSAARPRLPHGDRADSKLGAQARASFLRPSNSLPGRRGQSTVPRQRAGSRAPRAPRAQGWLLATPSTV